MRNLRLATNGPSVASADVPFSFLRSQDTARDGRGFSAPTQVTAQSSSAVKDLTALSSIPTKGSEDTTFASWIDKADPSESLARMVMDAYEKSLLPVLAEIRRVAIPEGGVAFYFAPKDRRKILASMHCFSSGEVVAMTSDRVNVQHSEAVEVMPSPQEIENQIAKLADFLG